AGAQVPATEALKVLELFNPAAIITGRARSMIAGDFAPTFELVMARKDVRLMLETAGSHTLATLPGIAARMDTLIAEGYGADDLAVLGKDAAGA
ncbi:MAG: NAD(P)-dependent oxidoreductase, partial [Gemmatimonadaceae bacterium]